jgi:glycosyltransferase involved in cell wall biosynthesis
MKVAIFLTYGYSFETWQESGVLERELKIYKKISDAYDVHFTFITYGNNSDFKFNIDINSSEVIPIYSLIKYSKFKILNYIRSFLVPFKLRSKLNEFDILHQHQLLGSWIPILLKILIKKPLLIRTGYDMLKFATEQRKGILVRVLYKMLTILSLKVCDLYTVTSSSDEKLFKNTKKIKIRPNWVELKEINPLDNRYKNRILCVGRLVSQKNYEYIIKEFKNTEDYISIDIYGTGPDEKRLVNLATSLNVNLNLLGNIDHNKLIKIYNKYIYFVTSSVFEGNPKTVLEAMSMGCVVLASEIPNHKEIILNNETGYIYELKDDLLIQLYKRINEDSDKLQLVSSSAFQQVRKNNSIQKLTVNMYEDYLSLN